MKKSPQSLTPLLPYHLLVSLASQCTEFRNYKPNGGYKLMLELSIAKYCVA